MAKETPLHHGETVDYDGWGHGSSWKIEPTHAGHTITVLGPIVNEGRETSICLVECSCGDRFRMGKQTVSKALERQAVAL